MHGQKPIIDTNIFNNANTTLEALKISIRDTFRTNPNAHVYQINGRNVDLDLVDAIAKNALYTTYAANLYNIFSLYSDYIKSAGEIRGSLAKNEIINALYSFINAVSGEINQSHYVIERSLNAHYRNMVQTSRELVREHGSIRLTYEQIVRYTRAAAYRDIEEKEVLLVNFLQQFNNMVVAANIPVLEEASNILTNVMQNQVVAVIINAPPANPHENGFQNQVQQVNAAVLGQIESLQNQLALARQEVVQSKEILRASELEDRWYKVTENDRKPIVPTSVPTTLSGVNQKVNSHNVGRVAAGATIAGTTYTLIKKGVTGMLPNWMKVPVTIYSSVDTLAKGKITEWIKDGVAQIPTGFDYITRESNTNLVKAKEVALTVIRPVDEIVHAGLKIAQAPVKLLNNTNVLSNSTSQGVTNWLNSYDVLRSRYKKEFWVNYEILQVNFLNPFINAFKTISKPKLYRNFAKLLNIIENNNMRLRYIADNGNLNLEKVDDFINANTNDLTADGRVTLADDQNFTSYKSIMKAVFERPVMFVHILMRYKVDVSQKQFVIGNNQNDQHSKLIDMYPNHKKQGVELEEMNGKMTEMYQHLSGQTIVVARGYLNEKREQLDKQGSIEQSKINCFAENSINSKAKEVAKGL